MYIDRVECSFDAAHRLLHYGGKCESPHGHTFKVEVFLRGESLNETGFLFDFAQLKKEIGGWIEAHWDHAFLLNDQDGELIKTLRKIQQAKLYLFPGENPTTEAMAKLLFKEAQKIYEGLVWKVRVWESPSQYAEYFEE